MNGNNLKLEIGKDEKENDELYESDNQKK